MNGYAIIDNEGGWLVNTVVWNGDLNVWQPPEGTHAVPVEDVDFNNLPPNSGSNNISNIP